jgi:simple sugar transport system ATP-binding protein
MPIGSHVEMRGICKRFDSVLANDNITITISGGEIHSLLGENGSGKSTLLNILSGIYRPDRGAIFIDGEEQHFRSPEDAIAAGIGMVHQHVMLIPVLTAMENICLGEKDSDIRRETSGAVFPNFFLRKKYIRQKIDGIIGQFGLYLDPRQKIYNMSIGEKQTVEIVKAFYRGAKILILDEPTAVLTPQESEKLFVVMRNMKARGCAIVIITHKLHEVLEISDRVTVLRRGKVAGTVLTKETNSRQLTEMMVGESIETEIKRTVFEGNSLSLLQVNNLNYRNAEGVKVLNNFSFTVQAGEILGVAGIAGNGQKELCEIIMGLRKAEGGSIAFLGEELIGLSPVAIKKRGIKLNFIPEDRLGMGLAGSMSIADNIMLKNYSEGKGPFVDRTKSRVEAEHITTRYAVSTPSIHHLVRKLSGGNIQKVLLGREIEMKPRLLITAYPVRGLDIGASYSIYDMLSRQKREGVGILYIGEDLDVLRELCDRLMVIHGGEIMGIFDPRAVSKEDIGMMMLGSRTENSAGGCAI